MQEQPHWFRVEDAFGVYNNSGDVIARNDYRDVQADDGTKQRVFPRIYVDPAYRGAGLARKLTRYSIDISIAEGFRIVPICPYIARWMREYDDGAYLPHQAEPGA